MRKTRIYQPQDLYAGQTLLLDSEASHHLRKVLRLRAGAELEVFNGKQAFSGTLVPGIAASGISSTATKCVEVLLEQQIQQDQPDLAEKLSIHLAPAFVKPAPFDLILQKTTELGVARITPLFTEFTQMPVREQRIARRYSHWSKVIHSACEQSGRYSVPELGKHLSFRDFLQTCQSVAGLKLICHPYENHKAKPADIFAWIQDQIEGKQLPLDIIVLLGPEGGFSNRELAMALDYGFECLQLGASILKADTAAIAVMSLLNYSGFQF